MAPTHDRRVRAILVGEDVRSVVHCPETGASVELEACVRCERFECIRLDGERGLLAVRCRADPGRPDVSTPLGDLVARVTHCVSLDTHVDAIRGLFLEHGISGAPVLDGRGRAMGIVSKTDLLQRHHGCRARDVMMPLVFSLADTATVGQAAALMAAERIHRVVVTTRDGSLLGIVSSLDVMRWLAEREGWLVKP